MRDTEPWYPDNFAKELYFAVVDKKDEIKDEKEFDKLAKSALIRWASEDLRRFIKMRENKQVLTGLHQRGAVGDEIWNRFTTSEKLLELELQEVAKEAETYQEGWSQQLFQTATEVTQNEAIRKRMAEFPKQQQDYREAYEAARKSSLADLTSS